MGSPSAGPSASDALWCAPALASDAAASLEAGYRYEAEGFVFQDVYDPDPLATPSTERVELAFEGAFAPPDRSRQRYTKGAPELEPEETRQIGRDLWLLEGGRWERLADAAEPDRANLLHAILEEVEGPWTASSGRGGGVCLLQAIRPLPGEGRRTIRLQLAYPSPRPTLIVVAISDAIDPSGNRRDSSLAYQVEHDSDIRVEEPR